MSGYKFAQLKRLYGFSVSREALIHAENTGLIPVASRSPQKIPSRIWKTEQLPLIGERYGFLEGQPSKNPLVVSVFTSKGGVLKTTLTMNIGRIAAIHNIKTLMIGLDFQGDLTAAMGFYPSEHESEDEALATVAGSIRRHLGLGHVFRSDANISDVIKQTDIPTLDIVPETHELMWLDAALAQELHREHWLQERILGELKKQYDLILFDCSPNWNLLTTNALAASDILLSPIECGINQYRNLEGFKELSAEFLTRMKVNIPHILIPTKLRTRKLSTEIKQWYASNVPGVTSSCIRDSSSGEQAMLCHQSVLEHAPSSPAADDFRALMLELWRTFVGLNQTDRAVA